MASRDPFAGLEPAPLWEHFATITTLPRPSGNESAIADYIMAWAKSNGFRFRQDSAGNISVKIPPSQDSPGPRSVALQAHLDMVCVRSEQSRSDPANGIIDIVRDGAWIVAPSSTLGADNGIGIAAAMAIAKEARAPHGPLELLFTVEEETSCRGADALEPDMIQARSMINLDAERIHALDIGSAGGLWSVLHWPLPAEALPGVWRRADISLAGLRGGHSGIDIGKNRLSAIKGIVWALRRLAEELTFRLCVLEGGDAINAIPIHARATVAFRAEDEFKLGPCLSEIRSELDRRFDRAEPGSLLTWAESASEATGAWSEADTRRFLDLLAILPSGVLAMEQHAPDLVETSSNVGIVALKQGAVEIHSLTRSSISEALQEVVASIRSAARLAGAEFAIVQPILPPWRVDPDSHLLATVQAAFRDRFQQAPKLVTTHAGTESGLIQQRIPGIDIISLGPEIQGAHMPGERVDIASVSDFYALLVDILQRLAKPPVLPRSD